MVDLILLERVAKLGQMGQLVKVKPGFARNYLLPQKKALRATRENLACFESQPMSPNPRRRLQCKPRELTRFACGTNRRFRLN